MKIYIILFLLYSIDVPIGSGLYISMDKILASVEDYYDDCGEYPLYPSDLSELLKSSKECWKGPYIQEKGITDRLNSQRYKIILKDNQVVIVSAGLDGKFNSSDDMSSADDIAKQNALINIYLDNKQKNDIYKYLFVTLVIISIFTGIYFVRKRRKN